MSVISVFAPLFHFLFNSFVVFFFLAFAVEMIFFIFKIKNARLRSFCRLLPLLKLPVDACLYFYFNDYVLFNFNPFSCQYQVTQLLAPHQTYCSIPNFLAMHFSTSEMLAILIFFFTSTAVVFGGKVYQIIKSLSHLRIILAQSKLMARKIDNEELAQALQSVTILTSQKITVPFATFGNRIVFPEALAETLSQHEFEAIIAHEWQHLRWKDPHTKVVGGLIAHLFWWLPTHWWMKRCEWEQECASDSEATLFSVKGCDLAGGILQTIKSKKNEAFVLAPVCHMVNELNVTKRLSRLLNSKALEEERQFKKYFWIGAFLCIAVSLTFGTV
jgi:beta-lactamase regulating signal transducer with metallopeptidase domain